MKNLLRKFLRIKFSYLFKRTFFIQYKGARVEIHPNAVLTECKIVVKPGALLKIDKGCIIKNTIMVVQGDVIIGENNILDSGYLKYNKIIIDKGTFALGKNNRIRSNIWVRFNGTLKINDYNNINEETEIRVDEKIRIGSYNQISYKCVIWDTNTHNIYDKHKRRELTVKHFPEFGCEYEKPKTAPIYIGSDCWIGREVSILKGVTINDSCIVGHKTLLSSFNLDSNTTIIPKYEYIEIKHGMKSFKNE